MNFVDVPNYVTTKPNRQTKALSPLIMMIMMMFGENTNKTFLADEHRTQSELNPRVGCLRVYFGEI